MTKPRGTRLSRRDFARGVALASAASVVPASTLRAHTFPAASSSQQPANSPALSAESQADAESRYQAILASYGTRFSDAQKSELRRLCYSAQPMLDQLRAYSITNADDPALYLKPLVEREKSSSPTVATPPANAAAKKP